MNKFNETIGKMAYLFFANIDTDRDYSKQYQKTIKRSSLTNTFLLKCAMTCKAIGQKTLF